MAKLHYKISPVVTIIALFFSYQDYKKIVGTCTLDFIAFSVQWIYPEVAIKNIWVYKAQVISVVLQPNVSTNCKMMHTEKLTHLMAKK